MGSTGRTGVEDTRFEEFVWLVDVGEDAVLLAWGGFRFGRDGADGSWRVVPAAAPGSGDPDRARTVGARSRPYGEAVVTVRDDSGAVVGGARTAEANHAWVTGLRPDTRYHYRIEVDGRPWADGPRWDWGPLEGGGVGPAPRGRSYVTTFRTHPARGERRAVGVAVLGDAGVGVCAESAASERQQRIADVLDRLVAEDEVRLVLTTGDNVYDGGDVDADWYAAWFQPYRYAIARVPVAPAVGNHDSAETEVSDDRDVLLANFHVEERFGAPSRARRAGPGTGLFYRFGYGADVEFVCLDTSEGLDGEYPHFYEHPEAQRFLRDALATGPDRPRWRIAYGHHPPYCAGPDHDGSAAMRERVVPLLRDGGADLLISGHEHNFQYAAVDGLACVVSGAAGKLQPEPPRRFAEARTRAWAAEAHLLHLRIDDELTVTPLAGLDADGAPRPLTARTPDGAVADVPFTVRPAADGAPGPGRRRT